LVAAAILCVVLYRWMSVPSGDQREIATAARSGTPATESGRGGRSGSGRGAVRGPVPVITREAQQEDFAIRRRTIGTMESPAIVTVRARLDSQVTEQHVRDGEMVKKGELLFTLDDREVRATIAKTEAQLAKDRATLTRTELDVRRAQELVERQAAPRTQLETTTAENKGALATVQADQAQLEADHVRLGYTKIVAPIDGRAGAVRITPGNLVSSGDTAGLVTLTQMQPLRVTFSLPERDLGRLRQAIGRTPPAAVRVYGPGSDKPLATGALNFIDTTVDPSSGTITARARFTNEDLTLWPGQFVDVEVDLDVRPNTVLVPAVAIQSGQQGQFVFVQKPDNTVEMRKVQYVGTQGDRIAIASGVNAGERVVVEGQMRLTDGARVAEAERTAGNAARDTGTGEGAATAPNAGPPGAGPPGVGPPALSAPSAAQ
jgi:multidrug efflux system membrane fusion protein